ncbi:MAG TPA: DUF5996 family protein [Thermoanaerobaculia bacterium]
MAQPSADSWPALPFDAWKDTCATFHLWTQVVGKIRLAQAPPINHWWQVVLYSAPYGLTTSAIPYGDRASFQIDFDLLHDVLRIETSQATGREIPLEPMSVAAFYRVVKAAMKNLGLDVPILPRPVEIPDAIPFEKDETHAAYDGEALRRFSRVLEQSTRVMTEFRARFLGKSSPPHLFWGALDLAVTRFSGRTAPDHAPVPFTPLHVVREAYSHECSSAGFWPGSEAAPQAFFYAYAYPEPGGFRQHPVRPKEAFYSAEMAEYLLPYEVVRTSRDPDATLMEFLQSTYEAAAIHGKWDRAALERPGS